MDIIFDIDGTLADAGHRLPYITNPEEPKNWDAFFAGVVNDDPIPEAWVILSALLRDGNRIILITGRPERLREATVDWLTALNCPVRKWAAAMFCRYGDIHLYMRDDGDRRPSSEVKADCLRHARNDGFNPKIAFEDRSADAQMWRDEGLLCCQVNEGKF